MFYRLIFGQLAHLVSHFTIADPLLNSTPAPQNPFLGLNLNMNVNLKTTVHDGMYKIECH